MALNYALVIARRYYSTIHLVHVIPLSQWPQPYDVTPPGPATEAVEEQRRIARQRLQSIAQRFANIPNHVWVEQGYPAEVVDVLAQAEHADLIVIGTHGFSGFKKFALGSVAEEIFRKALCPELTVGPHVRTVASDTVLRRILYPTDLLSGSYRGLSYALLLAADENAELTGLDLDFDSGDACLWSVAPRLSLNPLDVGLYLLVTELAARCSDRFFLSLRRRDNWYRASQVDCLLVSYAGWRQPHWIWVQQLGRE